MKFATSITLILVTAICYGQDWVQQTVPSPEYENQQIEYYTKLLSSAVDSNFYFYYDERALYKYRLKDYQGALEDVELSLSHNSNYCHALWLRGTIKLNQDKRDKACVDYSTVNYLCPDKYEEYLKYQCDRNWNYTDTLKVQVADSVYLKPTGYRKKEFVQKGNPFMIFYDLELTQIKEFYYTEKDTVFYESYYSNGQIKKLDKSYSNYGLWFYTAEWCANGQLRTEFNPNPIEDEPVKIFLCDGTISMEYLNVTGDNNKWFKLYHNNGQIAEKGNYELKSSGLGEQKVGVWESFSEDGKLIYRATFHQGKIVEEEYF